MMASLGIKKALPELAIRSPWSSRVFAIPVTTRHFQASSRKDACETTKQGVNEVKEKTKEMANEASDVAQNLTEKAKQKVEGAWESVKDTTEKAKDAVVGKAEGTKQFVKENADDVKRGMNSKN